MIKEIKNDEKINKQIVCIKSIIYLKYHNYESGKDSEMDE